ncbi:hypothetical protein BKA70DRAFT_1515396 [Coprinopsis sp. MPI-PUGE-AT-0042]|nr:hypothetical protein BKA70DRAFT_1515396 [Coprinopsis sp. MPI-PUGE-AT-0042]
MTRLSTSAIRQFTFRNFPQLSSAEKAWKAPGKRRKAGKLGKPEVIFFGRANLGMPESRERPEKGRKVPESRKLICQVADVTRTSAQSDRVPSAPVRSAEGAKSVYPRPYSKQPSDYLPSPPLLIHRSQKSRADGVEGKKEDSPQPLCSKTPTTTLPPDTASISGGDDQLFDLVVVGWPMAGVECVGQDGCLAVGECGSSASMERFGVSLAKRSCFKRRRFMRRETVAKAEDEAEGLNETGSCRGREDSLRPQCSIRGDVDESRVVYGTSGWNMSKMSIPRTQTGAKAKGNGGRAASFQIGIRAYVSSLGGGRTSVAMKARAVGVATEYLELHSNEAAMCETVGVGQMYQPSTDEQFKALADERMRGAKQTYKRTTGQHCAPSSIHVSTALFPEVEETKKREMSSWRSCYCEFSTTSTPVRQVLSSTKLRQTHQARPVIDPREMILQTEPTANIRANEQIYQRIRDSSCCYLDVTRKALGETRIKSASCYFNHDLNELNQKISEYALVFIQGPAVGRPFDLRYFKPIITPRPQLHFCGVNVSRTAMYPTRALSL